MKPTQLTVFTEPISAEGFFPRIKAFARPLKYLLRGKKAPQNKKYGGHYAVTRSLVEGLQKIGANFNYNPAIEKVSAENVIVLASVDLLKKMIELKNTGRIKRLFAGPNICESPNDADGILTNKAIDFCVVNSEWTAEAFLAERGDLQGRIDIWYAGVDTEFWRPTFKKKNKNVLLYWKFNDESFREAIEVIIRESGYNPVRITYGSYTLKQYKDVLDTADFAIFISKWESQGIALAEAWSMNVPTYVWDPKEVIYKNGKAIETTPCPYLTAESGLRWNELSELKQKIVQTRNNSFSFEPRKHALRFFSDERSASELMGKFGINVNNTDSPDFPDV